MAWNRCTMNDLRLVLAEDEIERLNTLSLDQSMTEVLQDTLDMVAETWRGAMKGKGMEIDPRSAYIPSAYRLMVLIHARYVIWSRFPNSSNIAIDEVRKKEYEQALEMLKNPIMDVDEVDWYLPSGEPNPELSAYVRSTGSSMTTPWLRFPTEEPVIQNFNLPTWTPPGGWLA